MLNPFSKLNKSAYELYKEDKKKKASTPSGSPRRTITYADKNFTGSSKRNRKSYDWEKDLLDDLPSKYFGKNQTEKFDNLMATKGLSKSDAAEFRTWMDSKEDGMRTSSDVKDNILSGSAKRAEDMGKLYNKKKPVEKKKTNKVLSVLDSTLGRASHAMQSLVLGKDFVENQDKAYQNTIDSKKSEAERKERSNRLKAITKKADTKTEKAADLLGKGLGVASYIVPGAAAENATSKLLNLSKATRAGAKASEKLAIKASDNAATKASKFIANRGGRGAISGGLFGVGDEAIKTMTGEDRSMNDRLKNIGINAAIGGVADPAIIGAGHAIANGLGRLAKGEVPKWTGKPSESVIDKLPRSEKPVYVSDLNSPAYHDIKDSVYRNSKFNNSSKVNDILNEIKSTRAAHDAAFSSVKDIQNEFDNAVKTQYNYLKNSMGKGTQPGGLIRDQEGFVTGAYGRISNNPKWYQDFYAATKRKPTNAELMELAKKHVKEGFEDEGGFIPAWTPKKIQEIDDQIRQYSTILREDPEQAPALLPFVKALEDDKKGLIQSIKDNHTNYTNLKGKLSSLNKEYEKIQAEPEYFKPVNEDPYNLSGARQTAAASENITPGGMRSGRDYEPIEPGGMNEYDIVKAPINRDIPYKEGDPLPDTLGHIATKTKKEKPTLSAIRNKAMIEGVDNLYTVNTFSKVAEKANGGDLATSENPYMLALNSRGSDQISKQILTENLVNKSGEVVGKSLKDIAASIPKKQVKEFEDYLIHKHGITRMERGEKVFPDDMQMNAAKSAGKVKEYETKYPHFKDIANEYYDFNKNLGKNWLVDNGIISEKEWNGYLAANPHYVPNNRFFSDVEQASNMGAKKGFGSQSNPIKKATGSQRKIISPIETTIEHAEKYVKTAKRNEVMQAVIKNIQKDPEAFKDWAEIVPTKETPKSVLDQLNENGMDDFLESFNKTFEQKPDLTKGNVLFGYVDGKKVHIKVHDKHFLEALTNLSPQGQNIVLDSVGKITRQMKTLTTGLNPVFSLTRNIWRDIPTSYVNSKSTNNPLTFSKDLVGAVVSVLRNDDLYKSFKAVGGGHSSPVSTDANLLAQSKQAILKKKGLKPLYNKAIGTIENLNDAVEAAPRLAEFKRFTKNDSSYDAKMKGLFEANDVTVNFNKYGNAAKQADKVIPYLNAALQGLDKTVRAYKDNKVVMPIKAFTAVTIPTIALYTINHDNPDYQEVADYIKDQNFLIPNGDGTFTKIPKPRELGVPFSAGVERVLNDWNNDDPEAFKRFGETIKTAFLPPVSRTILAPFNDIKANKNFMGAPIVPADLERLSPKYQYDAKTSEVAKGLGALMNKSPKQIDYLGRSYGGILAELGIPLTTKGGSVGGTLKQKVTADPVFSNDTQTDFYELKEKLDRANADYNRVGVKSKDYDDDLRKDLNARSREMGDYRKEIKSIQNDDSLNRKEKNEKIRSLQQLINDLARVSK